MDRAQVADAGQLQSFVGKPGEEVTIDLDILLDDAGRTDRSAECRRPAQRTGKGDGERARIERGHIDRDRPAMPRLDGELEAEHRIGLRSLGRDGREGDRPALAGTIAHAPCGTGNSTSSSSRSEEHTSELQSLMRITYTVCCLKKQKYDKTTQ